jgi:hypothetical protein
MPSWRLPLPLLFSIITVITNAAKTLSKQNCAC